MSRVNQVTWDWRSASVGGSRSVDRIGVMRRAALIQVVVMGLVGVVLHLLLHHILFARIIWGLAAVILILGLTAPRLYRPIYRFGHWLGQLVGKLMLYVLLVPFYFVLFVPVSLYLKLRGRDPLQRTRREPGLTYWIPRRPKARDANIADQFLREDKAARNLNRPEGASGFGEGGAS
ncbi:MAG: hypothetical protein GY835_14640 [bacterium]|nr:hypothetical protein [bacterium]